MKINNSHDTSHAGGTRQSNSTSHSTSTVHATSATRARRLKGLYGITDPELMPGDALMSGVEAALRGGTKIIQYRNKKASEETQKREALFLRQLCHEFDALFLINDNLELALNVNADGVHLGKTDGDIAEARTRLGPDKILGVTCHSDLAYADRCVTLGADYCAFGRVFDSRTKPDALACSFQTLVKAGSRPYATVAIGGINLDNAASLLQYEIDMLALIHGLFGQPDIESTARALSAMF